MATIKAAVRSGKLKSIINYVIQESKVKSNLVTGKDCSVDNTADEMITTKKLYGKLGGREYKHFTQNFHKDENITAKEAHEIAVEFANKCEIFDGFEVLIATHEDKEHIHSHFVVNSVNFNDGHKFQMKKQDLQIMKELSDELCKSRGLSICEKGKTFEDVEREETSAYSKETYQFLKKAEQGKVKSYVQDIALSMLSCKEQAISREDFIQKMNERGYNVNWQDTQKYITFIDLERQKQGEKQCKVRNNKLEKYYNIDFGKEELERGFTINARNQQTEQRRNETRERARHTIDRIIEQSSVGAGADDIGTFISNIRSQVGSAEAGRQEREAERIRRRAEREQRIKEAKREAAEREARNLERSRSRGFER